MKTNKDKIIQKKRERKRKRTNEIGKFSSAKKNEYA